MNDATLAVKNEQWGLAQRNLQRVQELVARLLRGIDDRTHEALLAPKPDTQDRG